MKKILYPQQSDWSELLKRPTQDVSTLFENVSAILKNVKANGDKAVMEYAEQFDHVKLESLAVTPEEMKEAEAQVPIELKVAILLAQRNIYTFHKKQKFEGRKVETMEGVTCWQKAVGIEKVGLYVPGGTAPLFSTVLMLAVPAKIAGCKEIVLCTPPNKEGKVHPAILYAAQVAGVSKIFKAGGVQAIGAMAYGTESIRRVYKIFGPGNRYVTKAKQMVSAQGTAIDMPAGPSEVMVMADATAQPAFVAADFLSQAEHGPDSQSLLVCNSQVLAAEVESEITRQLALLPRADIATRSLENSRIVVFDDVDTMVDFANDYAAEHLIIAMNDAWSVADRITAAGSIFVGHYSPESAGDYASGTNHTLPTMGLATAYSGIGLDSFMHAITYQELTQEGLTSLGNTIIQMAEAEGLDAHANSVAIRFGEEL